MPIIGATELQPVNILGQYVQGLEASRAAQSARQQDQLNALKMRSAQQEESRNALLMQALQSGASEDDLMRMPGGAAIVEQLAKARKERAGASTADIERRMKAAEFVAQSAGAFLSDPAFLSKDRLAPWVSELGQSRLISPEAVASFEQTPDNPVALAEKLQVLRRAGLDAKSQLQQEFTPQNLGGSVRLIATPKFGGGPAQVVSGSEAQVTMTPYERARIALERQDETRVVARTETAADGTVRFYNKFGNLLKTEVGVGKPSGAYEKSKMARQETQRNLSEALANLKEIVKPGGLIDQSTGSGAGRLRDVTAGFFGEATQGAMAAASLPPIVDQVLKLVPRFEGPQSNIDTQSYREAAGQLADPTLPSKVRKAAANTIIRLYERRQNQFTVEGEPASDDGWEDL